MKLVTNLTYALVTLAASLCIFQPALAKDGVIVSEPELYVVKQGGSIAVALPGGEYSQFEQTADSARFRIVGQSLPAGEKGLTGDLRRVSWQPDGEDMLVELSFAEKPLNSIISAVPESEYRPGVEQVIASFAFAPDTKLAGPPLGGGRAQGRSDEVGDPYGDYELPELKGYRYSDALVTLNVRNADFREVLWLLSEIGGVSIILDPYWNDEPTGTRRPPGAGVDPGSGGGDGAEPGFRPGGEFNPNVPGSGTGELSFNFEDVPFDTALELVVMAAGLVMVEVN